MPKEYVSGGYQIIGVKWDVDSQNTTLITLQTEDEKLLFELLTKGIEKPILFKGLLHDQAEDEDHTILCFPIYDEHTLYAMYGNYTMVIGVTSTQLSVSFELLS